MTITTKATAVVAAFSVIFGAEFARAQDVLPADNGLATYHTAPRYRESESHPLRLLGYVFHPVGWVLREGIFRPLSYFAGSTEETRSVMGFREPYDYRQPECFSADDSVPDCRSVKPFNYDSDDEGDRTASVNTSEFYLPDVNFDFNKHSLNDLGRGKVHQIADMMKTHQNVKVVLEGNTDYIGGDSYNQKLGMNRADAVRAELMALGVPAERIVSTVTFGKTQPLYTDKENWARAVNRRVSAKVQ